MDKKFVYVVYLLISSLICVTLFSSAEETENQIKLSLQECISLALKSNLNIRIQRINPKIQEALITMAKGRFAPAAA